MADAASPAIAARAAAASGMNSLAAAAAGMPSAAALGLSHQPATMASLAGGYHMNPSSFSMYDLPQGGPGAVSARAAQLESLYGDGLYGGQFVGGMYS